MEKEMELITCKVTKEQRQELNHKAGELELTISEYIRNELFNQPPKTIKKNELLQLNSVIQKLNEIQIEQQKKISEQFKELSQSVIQKLNEIHNNTTNNAIIQIEQQKKISEQEPKKEKKTFKLTELILVSALLILANCTFIYWQFNTFNTVLELKVRYEEITQKFGIFHTTSKVVNTFT